MVVVVVVVVVVWLGEECLARDVTRGGRARSEMRIATADRRQQTGVVGWEKRPAQIERPRQDGLGGR